MDNRHIQRIPAKLKIMLFREGLPVAIGHISNLSTKGAFVHTDYLSLTPSQSVEFELISGQRLKRRGNNKQGAVITRVDSTGVALQFDLNFLLRGRL